MRSELSKELKGEISGIYSLIKEHEEAKEVGIKLISKLKSEPEGRGEVSKEVLDKLRAAFKILTD